MHPLPKNVAQKAMNWLQWSTEVDSLGPSTFGPSALVPLHLFPVQLVAVPFAFISSMHPPPKIGPKKRWIGCSGRLRSANGALVPKGALPYSHTPQNGLTRVAFGSCNKSPPVFVGLWNIIRRQFIDSNLDRQIIFWACAKRGVNAIHHSLRCVWTMHCGWQLKPLTKNESLFLCYSGEHHLSII